MEYRMYSLVLKSLSTMQKGVQALHSTVEYARRYRAHEYFIQWADVDKTAIILDGGNCPELEGIDTALNYFEIEHTVFKEPDLNSIITSISILVPSSIYDIDKKDYDEKEETLRNLSESDMFLYDLISSKHLAR